MFVPARRPQEENSHLCAKCYFFKNSIIINVVIPFDWSVSTLWVLSVDLCVSR